MSMEENKAIVRRYFEDALDNPAVCDEIFAPEIRWCAIQHVTMNADAVTTPESEKEACQWLKSVWRDHHFEIDEMIAEDDRVMVRWTANGVQQGEYLGLPPTYRPVTYSGINIFRVVAGKIVQVSDIYDRLWLWQQLGVLPETKDFITQARKEILTKRK